MQLSIRHLPTLHIDEQLFMNVLDEPQETQAGQHILARWSHKMKSLFATLGFCCLDSLLNSISNFWSANSGNTCHRKANIETTRENLCGLAGANFSFIN